jgi:hypothetical protein
MTDNEALLDEYERAVAMYQNAKSVNERANHTRTAVKARAAILDAMTRPAVPDGWVLVPKVPTNEMLTALWGYEFSCENDAFQAVDCYTSMLAAAPAAPVASRDDVLEEAAQKLENSPVMEIQRTDAAAAIRAMKGA